MERFKAPWQLLGLNRSKLQEKWRLGPVSFRCVSFIPWYGVRVPGCILFSVALGQSLKSLKPDGCCASAAPNEPDHLVENTQL